MVMQNLLNFKFEYYPDVWENDIVHVWRSKNQNNGLIYGYGGVKLFPTQLCVKQQMECRLYN